MSLHVDSQRTGNKRPIIADEFKLFEHKCLKHTASISTENNHDIFVDSIKHPSGWKFIAHHSNILTSSELNTVTNIIKDRLACSYDSLHQDFQFGSESNDLRINSAKLNLPPMLFGNDVFRMEISNIAIELNASDAIMCWASQHVNEELIKSPITDIKVPYAKKWTKLVEDTNKSSVSTDMTTITNNLFHSDWTFSSDYIVTTIDTISHNEVSDEEINLHQYLNNNNKSNLSECNASILRKSELKNVKVSQDFLLQSVKYKTSSNKSNTGSWSVVLETDSGVDYNLLRCTDQPILFFDEFVLYQDDLEDCGEISYDAKIRVMPSCWFVLSKQYLRVDGSAIRCREVRLFHNFENDISYHNHHPQPQHKEHESEGNKEEVQEPVVVAASSVRIHMEVCWRELIVDDYGNNEDKGVLHHNNTKFTTTTTTSNTTSHTSVLGFSSTTLKSTSNSSRTSTSNSATNITSSSISSSVSNNTNGLCRDSSLWGKDGKNLTHLLPLVNEKEGISQYYTLTYKFL